MNVPSLYSLPMYSRATSAVHGYPSGIGPVSRTLTADGFMEDIFAPAIGIVKPVVGDILQTQWVRAVVFAKEKLGYKNLGTVFLGGKPYVKMMNPQNVPVYIDDRGIETVVTEQSQGAEKKVDPTTGRIVTGAAIGLGVIAAAAALFFILRRR